MALEEEDKRNKIKQILDGNLDNLEMNGNDQEFAQKVIDDVLEMSIVKNAGNLSKDKPVEISVDNILRIRRYDDKGQLTSQDKYDEYERRKKICINCLV